MARNKTSGKGAAQKAADKHAVRKTASMPEPAKAGARKSHHVAKAPDKKPQKPAAAKTVSPKSVPQKKVTAAAVKPAVAKPPLKPAAAPNQAAAKAGAASVKPMLPKAVAMKHAIAAAASRQAAAPGAGRTMPAAVNKAAGQKITAPAATPPVVTQAAAQAAANKKPVNQRHGFKTNEWIVYPSHGVGRIVAIEEQEIAGLSLELFVITFEKDKMTLRVPTGKSQSVGMRKLAEDGIVKRAMETLKGKARIKRTMWSRRAQEYEAKINSGDLIAIAEVVRDLYRSESQPEQSYSERQLYEAALDRMAREIAAVDKIDERGAVQRITEVLSKSAKGRRAAAEETATAEVKAA
jgi:CarD family transcriptional regulator